MAASETSLNVWVLVDDRAGNRAQALGVGEKLRLPFDIKEIRYGALGGLPNILRGSSLLGLTTQSKKRVRTGPFPSLVISAGRRTAPVARYIKKHRPKTRLIHIMWPDAGMDAFDCIVLPTHDREHADRGNVLRVLGAPHRINEHLLMAARHKWEAELPATIQPPRIAVLLGGSSKHGKFNRDDFTALGKLAHRAAECHQASLLVSTSRRTGKSGEEAFMAEVEDTLHHLHRWNGPTKPEANPYMGYLALADAIIVTADSISMCSEACFTGKPVYIYVPKTLSAKHRRFVNILIAGGYANELDSDSIRELRPPMKKDPLDSASTVAHHIITQLL